MGGKVHEDKLRKTQRWVETDKQREERKERQHG